MIFNIGENCLPENCTSSCKRKGRSHYHLKLCLGGDSCAAILNPFVRHSDLKYYPHEDKKFDLYLCEYYWQNYGWEMPVDDSIKFNIKKCNFICSHPEHQENHSFCLGLAWHIDDH